MNRETMISHGYLHQIDEGRERYFKQVGPLMLFWYFDGPVTEIHVLEVTHEGNVEFCTLELIHIEKPIENIEDGILKMYIAVTGVINA